MCFRGPFMLMRAEVGVVRMGRWLYSQIRFALSRKSARGNRASDKSVTDETTAGKVFSPIQTCFMWQRNEAFFVPQAMSRILSNGHSCLCRSGLTSRLALPNKASLDGI